MKAILLVSSIFYLLGLTISNNVNFFKKDKVSATEVSQQVIERSQSSKDAIFTKELNSLKSKSDPDSLKNSGSSQMIAPCIEKGIE